MLLKKAVEKAEKFFGKDTALAGDMGGFMAIRLEDRKVIGFLPDTSHPKPENNFGEPWLYEKPLDLISETDNLVTAENAADLDERMAHFFANL